MIPDQTIEQLLYRWGRWRNRDLIGGLGQHSAETTNNRVINERQYWRQGCYATGADLSASAVGSGGENKGASHEAGVPTEIPNAEPAKTPEPEKETENPE